MADKEEDSTHQAEHNGRTGEPPDYERFLDLGKSLHLMAAWSLMPDQKFDELQKIMGTGANLGATPLMLESAKMAKEMFRVAWPKGPQPTVEQCVPFASIIGFEEMLSAVWGPARNALDTRRLSAAVRLLSTHANKESQIQQRRIRAIEAETAARGMCLLLQQRLDTIDAFRTALSEWAKPIIETEKITGTKRADWVRLACGIMGAGRAAWRAAGVTAHLSSTKPDSPLVRLVQIALERHAGMHISTDTIAKAMKRRQRGSVREM